MASNSVTYFIPGMGASPDLFFGQQSLPFDKVFLSWKDPLPGENLEAYAKRFIADLDLSRPVNLVGVSFGGVLAQEIASIIPIQKVILISSPRTLKQLRPAMKWMRYLPMYRMMPDRWPPLNKKLIGYMFGITKPADLDFFIRIITTFDFKLIKWSVRQLIRWVPKPDLQGIVSIMGDKDRIFGMDPKANDFVIKGGTHYMIVDRAREINKLLEEIISVQ